MSDPAVSVVVPVRDERDNLQPFWEELRPILEGLGRDFEVIFADDGSEDGSAGILDGMARADRRVRVLHLEAPSGQSAALDACFRDARGDLVITLDADLQNDPSDIPRLLELMGTLDLISGYRIRRRDPWLRRVSSRLANTVRNLVTGDHVRDTGCSLKIFRKRCLERIRAFDGMHRFLPTLLRLDGFTVGEAPVGHRPRVWGASKYSVHGRLFRAGADLLAVRWMIRRRLSYRVRKEEGLSGTGRNSRAV